MVGCRIAVLKRVTERQFFDYFETNKKKSFFLPPIEVPQLNYFTKRDRSLVDRKIENKIILLVRKIVIRKILTRKNN